VRILQIVNPAVAVPPKTMGGVERVVYALIRALSDMGHEVTLLAEDMSRPPERVRFEGIGTYWQQERTVEKVWRHLLREGGRYDVIHNHGRLLYWLPRVWGRAAKVHTFHFGELQLPQVKRFLRLRPRRFAFAPCGRWIAEKYHALGGTWRPVHNGLLEKQFAPRYAVSPDAPFVCIGRMDPRKGIPQAIEVASRAGRRLVIAGVIGDQPHEKEWFERNVLARCDGRRVQFVGPVDDRQKQELLANAAGLLLPIQGSEAFTVVMIEALACGCPVIGLNRYCIPELVRDGFNGILAEDLDEMVRKLPAVASIDRRNCRTDFEARFSATAMTQSYLRLYAELRDERGH
jgi:glycosyltransferase involved in cell wall biosynthesis